MPIRRAEPDDVPALVDLAAAKRAIHEGFQPIFWRAHRDAREMQDAWFRFLLTSDSHAVLVEATGGDVDGFLIAQVLDAPPVYDPGGRTCTIDDFVASPGPVFDALVAEARRWAADQGAVQVVVVVAALDEPKKAALAANGLTVASEWWVGPVA